MNGYTFDEHGELLTNPGGDPVLAIIYEPSDFDATYEGASEYDRLEGFSDAEPGYIPTEPGARLEFVREAIRRASREIPDMVYDMLRDVMRDVVQDMVQERVEASERAERINAARAD